MMLLPLLMIPMISTAIHFPLPPSNFIKFTIFLNLFFTFLIPFNLNTPHKCSDDDSYVHTMILPYIPVLENKDLHLFFQNLSMLVLPRGKRSESKAPKPKYLQ